MKSITVASIATLGFISNAAANLAVLTPWNGVTWTSGGVAEISWSADVNDAAAQCHIQLMNGDNTDGQIVAYVTNPQVPVPCSDRKYDISPLNDFSPGDYWIRVGSGDTWAYSSKFKFDGKGTVDTRKIIAPVNILMGESNGSLSFNPSASTPPMSGSGTAPPTATATGTGTPSGKLSSGAVPSSNPSAGASSSANMSLSGNPSKSAASSKPTSSSSSKGRTSNNKKNTKAESAAAAQSSQGWMMAGFAAVVAAMAF